MQYALIRSDLQLILAPMPLTPWAAQRWTHFRSAEYVKCRVSETVWRRWPLTTSRTAWARRKTRASVVCFKKVSQVGRASSGKCSLRVRMRVVSRITYYKNRSTPHHLTWLLYYRSTAFPTQIFRDLLQVQRRVQAGCRAPSKNETFNGYAMVRHMRHVASQMPLTHCLK